MYSNTYMVVYLLKYIQDAIGYYSVCEYLDHMHYFFSTADEIKYKRVMKLFHSQINE